LNNNNSQSLVKPSYSKKYISKNGFTGPIKKSGDSQTNEKAVDESTTLVNQSKVTESKNDDYESYFDINDALNNQENSSMVVNVPEQSKKRGIEEVQE